MHKHIAAPQGIVTKVGLRQAGSEIAKVVAVLFYDFYHFVEFLILFMNSFHDFICLFIYVLL